MFGQSYFGPSYYGTTYFGPAHDVIVQIALANLDIGGDAPTAEELHQARIRWDDREVLEILRFVMESGILDDDG